MAIGNTIFEWIASILTAGRWSLEKTLIVNPTEGVRRLWYRLDPRLYSQNLRVRRITEGGAAKKSNRYILLVLVVKHQIPVFIQTLIDAVGRSPLNLIVVSNGNLSPELRDALAPNCHLLVERAGLGRDFGGYRDGINILFARTSDIERLIIINDSLFYLESGADRLLADLDRDEDVIGMTENFHFYYHLQSFALSFSRAVVTNKRFRRYWRKYVPISTRYWAVGKGERGLTRQLMRAGFRPYILYHGSQLTPHLKSLDIQGLQAAVQLMPSVYRDRLFAEFDGMRDAEMTETLTAVETFAKSARRISRLDDAQLGNLPAANLAQILAINGQTVHLYRERQRWLHEHLGERIVSAITAGNQIHIGGFLFIKFLHMPAFKRDVFFREVYGLEEIEEIISTLGLEMKEEIVEELRQRGTARLLRGLPRILYRHGAI